MTQIWNKQQCLTVCAANGLKKEQLASTDGQESQSGIKKKNRVVCTDLCSAPPAAGGNEHCVNWHDTINTNSFSLFAGRRWDLKGGEPAERFKLMTAKNTHEEIMKETCPVKEKQAFIRRFKGQTVKDLTLNPRQDPCRHPVDGYFRSLSVHQSQHTSFFLRLCLSLLDSSTGDAASQNGKLE